MELRQLECLVRVADAGSFTRAAAAMRLAQPGVSAHVRRLQAELGQQLLDRTGREVRPTALGEAVLVHARAALAAAAGVREAVAAAAGLLAGRVVLGTLAGAAPPVVDDGLAASHAEHPDVELVVEEGRSDALAAGLLDGRRAGVGRRAAGPDARAVAIVAPVLHGQIELARRRGGPSGPAAVELLRQLRAAVAGQPGDRELRIRRAQRG